MRVLFFLIVLINSLQANSQINEITSGVSTKIVIDKIKDGLSDVVNEAMDRADLTVAKAAIQALGVIDAWKKSNTELLEISFDKLDEATRDLFSRTTVLINEVNDVAKNNLETARQITENANQITESLIGSKKRSFILRYTPMVINPSATNQVLVRLRGVNLDIAEPQITLEDNSSVVPNIVGPQEITFQMPISALKRDKNKSGLHRIKIKHQTRNGSTWYFWPKYETVERVILLGTLPQKVGDYEIKGTRSFKKEERIIHTVDMGKFKARNNSVSRVANPPTGYLWDLRKGIESQRNFAMVSTGRGEKGRCEEIIWNGSNEHGIIGRARLDEIRQIRGLEIRWKSGYKHCGIRGPIYRLVPTTESIESKKGELLWNKDQIISLPEDITEFILKIRLFTGEERIITNSYSDNILDVTKESNKIIIRNKVPKDIIN